MGVGGRGTAVTTCQPQGVTATEAAIGIMGASTTAFNTSRKEMMAAARPLYCNLAGTELSVIWALMASPGRDGLNHQLPDQLGVKLQ